MRNSFPIVCISVLDRFRETLSKEDSSNPPKIEAAFRKFCADLKNKENRFVSVQNELKMLVSL